MEGTTMAETAAETFGSYSTEDVIFLLKDLSAYELEGATENREKRFSQASITVKRFRLNTSLQPTI